tara:strand:- start:1950 stop:2216 length:267 start_codon:yes stop_codon:yes gene_type:complete
MSELIERMERAWDWPVTSRFATTAEERKSLRASAHFGAITGGIAGGGLSMEFAKSDGVAILLSFSAVLLGYYGGSLCWKILKNHKMAP